MITRVLCDQLLSDQAFWKNKNVDLPRYARSRLKVTSLSFSAGRMAFAHTADIVQDLLNEDPSVGMIAGIETFSPRYATELAVCDFLVTQLIFLNDKGSILPRIQGAMKSVYFVDASSSSIAWSRLRELALDPQVRYATINAPEGAYGIAYAGGDFAEPVIESLKNDCMQGTLTSDGAKWTAFALKRFEAGLPFAFVSCTNFPANGHVTRATLCTVARAWEEKGFAPKGFLDYLRDPLRCGFPSTMIDRIAVAPDQTAREALSGLGIESTLVVTEKTRYWIVEDQFPAGRPAFEKARGVVLERGYDEVRKYEEMKLRMLNMAHSTIAGLGVLVGYRGEYGVYKAMQDPDIRNLITKIVEIVIGTIDSPLKIDPEDFARDTFARLDNQNIPDDPMRIALNGSTKMYPRFMDTFFSAREKGTDLRELDLVLLPVAGFLRYTLGTDDTGTRFTLEDDPLKDLLTRCARRARLGDPSTATVFSELIARKEVMGRNLYYENGTGKRMEELVASMLSGPGAVRATVRALLDRGGSRAAGSS